MQGQKGFDGVLQKPAVGMINNDLRIANNMVKYIKENE